MNFLEQLAAEWYATQGYFVRTNVKANRRPNGGWNNELDVLALQPKTRVLVHVETSWDAHSWSERKARFTKKKFVFSDAQYHELVGIRPASIRKRAVVGTTQAPPSGLDWGPEIEVVTVPQFVEEICGGLRDRSPLRDVIPETHPCLRSIQFALAYGVGPTSSSRQQARDRSRTRS